MSMPSVPEIITDLRAHEYRGQGGLQALAEDVRVPYHSLRYYGNGRRQPSYRVRLQLEAFWQAVVARRSQG